MENCHWNFFFENFLFSFFWILKGLASNAEVNPNIEKRQFPGNDAKNLLQEKVLIFINPKCKVYRWVLGMSFAGNCVSNYQSSLERLNLGEINGEEGETKLRYKHRNKRLGIVILPMNEPTNQYES